MLKIGPEDWNKAKLVGEVLTYAGHKKIRWTVKNSWELFKRLQEKKRMGKLRSNQIDIFEGIENFLISIINKEKEIPKPGSFMESRKHNDELKRIKSEDHKQIVTMRQAVVMNRNATNERENNSISENSDEIEDQENELKMIKFDNQEQAMMITVPIQENERNQLVAMEQEAEMIMEQRNTPELKKKKH